MDDKISLDMYMYTHDEMLAKLLDVLIMFGTVNIPLDELRAFTGWGMYHTSRLRHLGYLEYSLGTLHSGAKLTDKAIRLIGNTDKLSDITKGE